jgi:hypothetical protein
MQFKTTIFPIANLSGTRPEKPPVDYATYDDWYPFNDEVN